jgi:hypothetical protein
MPADPPDLTLRLSEEERPTVHMTAANIDLFSGDSPAPSEEGMPPAAWGAPVDLGVPRLVDCPPCTRYRCPARRWPHGRATPWWPAWVEEIQLDWTHPLRGPELRNTLSRWLLVAAVGGSALFWGGLFAASVAP